MRTLKRTLLVPVVASIAVAADAGAGAALGPNSHSNESQKLVILGGTLIVLGLCPRWFARR